MMIPERIFCLAASIIAASKGQVEVDRALMLAERIVEVAEQLGRRRVLEILIRGGEA
jgi:hypothetical protein